MMGNWIHTYKGRKFSPLNPKPDQVEREDIAHSLALKCRWTGHCKEFYSIAEHSIRVKRLIEKWGGGYMQQLDGLLHDAGETYLADVASPIKMAVALCTPRGPEKYNETEAVIMEAIYEHFGLGLFTEASHNIVKRADEIMLITEARDLLHGTEEWGWQSVYEPDGEIIRPLPWLAAEATYLSQLEFLLNKVKQPSITYVGWDLVLP